MSEPRRKLTILVPDLPLSMQRCETTGEKVTDCTCRSCSERVPAKQKASR